ncbi:MAG: NADH-quinone oxidoreductase subunit L, partial [Geobacteraceae bacterium]|nr:NADH-quinone oxidoreductase subunit L [Geobacteraceae bacterium]
MKLSLELILLLPLLGSLCNGLLGGIIPRRLAEAVACAAIWGSFVATLTAAAAYSAPITVEIASWLAVFSFKAPLTL